MITAYSAFLGWEDFLGKLAVDPSRTSQLSSRFPQPLLDSWTTMMAFPSLLNLLRMRGDLAGAEAQWQSIWDALGLNTNTSIMIIICCYYRNLLKRESREGVILIEHFMQGILCNRHNTLRRKTLFLFYK